MAKAAPASRLRFDQLPTPALITQGEALLASQNYKDAIDLYKQLLKREPHARWQDTLATAYLERAKQLAAKALYREAIVLWENIPERCGLTLRPDLYIDWLLHAGQYAKAMSVYSQHTDTLAGAGELETQLALLALSGQKDILQALSPETPLRQQLTAIQAALQAYSRGEADATVRVPLQQIPMRSPYRDLRQLLVALLKLESDPASALPLIERIPSTSPYAPLAAVVRACASPDPIHALRTLDSAQRELAGSLLGFNPQQLKLLREWARLGNKPGDKALFDFIIAQLPLLERTQARHACRALLATYFSGHAIYLKLFGALPAFENYRLQALRSERARDLDGALQHWQQCVDALLTDAETTDHADSRLMAALVLRHMAQLFQNYEEDFWVTPPEIFQYLEKSLQLDPDDRATYLQLATLHQKDGEDKEYHQWIERAVKHFPNDPIVLLAAVETATARKAHKKAATFAARVLELDPINNKARTTLINAHLAHARKQILAGKYALAEKELENAHQLERDNARTGLIELNRGLLAHQQNQREQADRWLHASAHLIGRPFLMWFRVAMEAARLKLDPTPFQRGLKLGNPQHLSLQRADLLALTRIIESYREEGATQLVAMLTKLEKPLKNAVQTLTSEHDFLALCDCLHQVPHYPLLHSTATQALIHYPNRPLFIYYQIFGRAKGLIFKVNDEDYAQLEQALEQAISAKDQRARAQLERFLREDDFSLPGAGPSGGLAMPEDLKRELSKIRQELNQLPAAAREAALDQFLDSLPPDSQLPPETQRMVMRLLILGEDGLSNLLDDSPLPALPAQGRGRKRRS